MVAFMNGLQDKRIGNPTALSRRSARCVVVWHGKRSESRARSPWPSRIEARAAPGKGRGTCGCLYNTVRPHSACDRLPPRPRDHQTISLRPHPRLSKLTVPPPTRPPHPPTLAGDRKLTGLDLVLTLSRTAKGLLV